MTYIPDKLRQFDEFTQGYVACALWLTDDSPGSGEWDKLDEWLLRLDDSALDQMVKDCADFQQAQADLLVGLDLGQCGNDFWLTRNGHGAGFWARGLGQVGQRLTEACKPYGTADLYIGDDWRVYHHS